MEESTRSDSPELNIQSKEKIEAASDVFPASRLVVIDNDFNRERFTPGHIYFLNTQKLGVSSLLTKPGDAVSIRRARKLYATQDFGIALANTVYALDSTTINLCRSLFPWADFRSTKAAVKMHSLLDLRGPIPSFIHVSVGKMGDARALDMFAPEAGSIYVMDRGFDS